MSTHKERIERRRRIQVQRYTRTLFDSVEQARYAAAREQGLRTAHCVGVDVADDGITPHEYSGHIGITAETAETTRGLCWRCAWFAAYRWDGDKVINEAALPYWDDPCGHGVECYVGTVEVFQRDDPRLYDVYVYAAGNGQEVCLRYGDKPHEYLSPGPLWQFIQGAATNDKYAKALELIRARGDIHFTFRREQ